ncbi:MAG: DivIVA domain-containing protein [Oscillospiraceae bacterium]|nr:DivIVA domain-containing protein [Oscillospiraceae bacterium]
MMTPQDLKDKKFDTVLLNGYNMVSVDDFLESVSEDYAALYKENAVLKSKLKVLVEKVEEYRSTEDSMRMALLTAQKMGDELLEESRAKGDAILAEVNEQAKRRAIELQEQLAIEEARLATAEQRTSEFSKKVLRLIADETDFIERLGELVISDPAAVTTPEPPAAPVVPVAPVAPPVTAPEPTPVSQSEDTDPMDKMQAAIEASLAEEVSRMTEELMSETKSEAPIVEPDIPVEPVNPTEPAESVLNITLPTDLREQKKEAPTSTNLFDLFDQDRIEEAFQQSRTKAVQEVTPAQTAPPPVADPALDAKEAETLDIARDISASLGDTQEFKVDPNNLWDDEGEPTTKRPKFDFDDLQFGSNFGDEDDN